MNVLLSLLLVAVVQAAIEPRVEVHLPTRTLTVGDPFEAQLILSVPEDFLVGEPRFPTWTETWGRCEILAVGDRIVSAEPGAQVYRQTLRLAGFETGTLSLPSVEIKLPRAHDTLTLTTPGDLAIHIESVLPPGGEQALEPQPPEAPGKLPLGDSFWWSVAVFLGLIGIVGLLLALRHRSLFELLSPSQPIPLAELQRALHRLQSEENRQVAHTRLSHVLRRYLGRSLVFPALESTSSQIARRLRNGTLTPPLEPRAVRRVVELLRHCDQVKFAQGASTPDQILDRLAQAGELGSLIDGQIKRTKPETQEAAA